jgi:hypothetical protein
MKKFYKTKQTNITKLKSYLDKKPKIKNNDRPKRHNTSRTS